MLFHKPAIHAMYVLCYLSRQKSDNVVSAARIADAMSVPPEQAAKVLQVLQGIGLVTATRGRTGGYRLARSLDEITVLEVIDALAVGDEEERLQPRSCPTATQTCSAHGGMLELSNRVRSILAQETLSNLLGAPCSHGEAQVVQLRSDGEPQPSP